MTSTPILLSGQERRKIRAVLFIVGILSFVRGWSYLPIAKPDSLPYGLDQLSAFLPIWFWGGLWCVAALEIMVSVFHPRARLLAICSLISMNGIWAAAYASGWVATGFDDRSYLNVISYLIPLLLLLPHARRSRDAA